MKHLSLILITLSLISCGSAKDKTWTKHQIYRGSRLCNGLDPADFNRDGFLDYATNFEDTGKIEVVLHPGPSLAKDNCEEYSIMGVEWFENPGDRKNPQAQVDAVNMERVAIIPLTGGKAGQLNHMAVNDEQKHLFVAKKN